MRWYTSTNGQTSGPHEESAMRELVDRGYVNVTSQVRDEAGGGWMPIHVSPLAAYVADQIAQHNQAADRADRSRILLIGAGIVLLGYGLISWLGNEWEEQQRKSEAECVKFWGGGSEAEKKCRR